MTDVCFMLLHLKNQSEARAFPDGRAAYQEDRNEEEAEEHLRKN